MTPADRLRPEDQSTEELSRDMSTLAQRLAHIRRKVAEGEVIDLTPMQTSVAGFCRAIEALPSAAARDLEPNLISLVEELDRLSETMRDGLAQLASGLSETSQRRRALHAYGKK